MKDKNMLSGAVDLAPAMTDREFRQHVLEFMKAYAGMLDAFNQNFVLLAQNLSQSSAVTAQALAHIAQGMSVVDVPAEEGEPEAEQAAEDESAQA